MQVVAAGAARSPRSRARSASSSRSSCSPPSTRSRSGPRSSSPSDEKWIALVVLVAGDAAIDLVYLSPAGRLPAQVPGPGTVFLLAFQVVPIVYTSTSPSRTGRRATSSRRTRRSRDRGATRSPQSDDGGTYMMAPARDATATLVLLLVDDATGKALRRRRPRGSRSYAARPARRRRARSPAAGGYTLLQGSRPARPRQAALATYTVPVGGDRRSGRRGSTPRSSSRRRSATTRATDTFTRIEDGVGLPGQRRGLVRRGERRGARAGLAHLHRRRATSAASSTTRSSASRSCASSSGRSRSRRSAVLFSFVIGLFLAIVLDKPGLRFPRVYRVAARHPVRDPGLPLAARLGGPAERRLRRRQPRAPHEHPVALRPDLGEGLGDHSSASGSRSRTSSSSRWARSSRSRAS